MHQTAESPSGSLATRTRWRRLAVFGLILALSLCPAPWEAERSAKAERVGRKAPNEHRARYGTAVFPCPDQLTPTVEFWVRVFTRYSASERVLHDARYPWIVYEVVSVAGQSPAAVERAIADRKRQIERILESAAAKAPAEWSPEEQRVATLCQDVPEGARLTRARERIRSQPGLREDFLLGLRRSGRWSDAVREVLTAAGAPPELAHLPHVESSYNPAARSRAGAVGLWQLTTPAARGRLRIEHDLDERLDPLLATEAAARYLLEARHLVGSWPLAVVAYNHGVQGVLRARKVLDTDDLPTILQEYDGPRFRFASRNFYPEFLAAIEVGEHPEVYFGPVLMDLPVTHQTLSLRHWVNVQDLAEAFGLTPPELGELNPALGASYLQGSRLVPKGYPLRLPAGQSESAELAYNGIDPGKLLEEEPRPKGYTVLPGDTLSSIARRHRVSVQSLRRLNSIPGDRIYPGQVLVLPDAAHPGL